VLALGGIYRAKGAGASLLPPYCYTWGVGLYCPAAAPGGIYRANGAGVSLLPPYCAHGEQGFTGLPRRRVSWPVGVAGRARLP
jgi:hypothetical protein